MNRWWRENLPVDGEVFEAELLKTEALLSRHPEAMAPYSRRVGVGVRRTLLEGRGGALPVENVGFLGLVDF